MLRGAIGAQLVNCHTDMLEFTFDIPGYPPDGYWVLLSGETLLDLPVMSGWRSRRRKV